MIPIPILTHFYDIESVENVFTLANYKPEGPSLDVYYLADDSMLVNVQQFQELVKAKVYEKNQNFNGEINLMDLHLDAANWHLAREFGLSNAMYVNNPDAVSNYPAEFRLVCDTDPGYSDEVYPYLLGYNSYNYDTTILALYLKTVFPIVDNPNGPYQGVTSRQVYFRPTTAKLMRAYNDQLFSKRFKGNMPDRLMYSYKGVVNGEHAYEKLDYTNDGYLIRKNMLMSGRHLDVARLNEKAQHNALKRLLGMLGCQILESDKLKPGQNRINNFEEFCELIAYNASDVINLKHTLFDHQVYQGNFDLKKGLLETYPELVYEKRSDKYAPMIDPYHVRRDRLFIDSSSAQLATKALCPYGHLTDIPMVDFLYPAREKAIELGIPQVDVLEQTRQLFEAKFPQPEIRAQFYRIYNFYANNVRGHNFNESRNFKSDYGNQPGIPQPEDSSKLPKENLCIPYYYADGTPSTCYAQFSIGGIHGAEYNKQLFDYDVEEYEKTLYRFIEVKKLYPDPTDLKKARKVEIMEPDGSIKTYDASEFLKSGSTMKEAFYKDPPDPPELFALQNGSFSLNGRYNWTSADLTNHEDFTSYYPNLLRMMRAFWNDGLGYDRYADIFEQKQTLGKKMKDKSISDAERQKAAVQREGTKLVLNSASGAADATFESNIRMNNNIIKMRVIGQLFSYTIAMSQTYYGARIPSTNTDGLYSVMEATRNNQILEHESANIGVEIEPEIMYLITKDTNNRIELDHNTGAVKGASGGTLACQSWAGKKGPAPTKSLAHCAITDWALCEYLVFAATGDQIRASLQKPFNPEVGLKILLSAQNKMDKVRLLNMFQNVIASSPSSNTYIFGTAHGEPDTPIVLQHYNRVFIMRDNTPNTIHLHAATLKKLTPVQIKKRDKEGERRQQHDSIALYVLNTNGVETNSIEETHEANIKKITDVDPKWFMYIDNRHLSLIPEHELDFIIANLDYGKYLYLLAKAFDGATLDGNGKRGSNSKGWRNKPPHAEATTDIQEFIHDIDTAAAKLNIVLPGDTNLHIIQKLQSQQTDDNDSAAENTPQDIELPFPQEHETTETINVNQEPAQPAPEQTPEPTTNLQDAPKPWELQMPQKYDPNNLADIMQAQSQAAVQSLQTELKAHLTDSAKLIAKIKAVPNNGLTRQYIAELQRAVQTAIERI